LKKVSKGISLTLINDGVEHNLWKEGQPVHARDGEGGDGMTPEEIIVKIIEKVEEGDPEILGQISLVMKNRVLNKRQDLKEIEALLAMQVKKQYSGADTGSRR
jgi:hypothetical protein